MAKHSYGKKVTAKATGKGTKIKGATRKRNGRAKARQRMR